jgi:splicing factor 3B subunit 1
MTPDQWHADKAAREMYERNRPLSDEELDALLPGAEQVGKP